MQVFGQGQLQQMAANSGMDLGSLSGGLADMLPQMIDRMTPQGQVPARRHRRRAGRTLEDDAARLSGSAVQHAERDLRVREVVDDIAKDVEQRVALLGIELGGARQPVEQQRRSLPPAVARADSVSES